MSAVRASIRRGVGAPGHQLISRALRQLQLQGPRHTAVYVAAIQLALRHPTHGSLGQVQCLHQRRFQSTTPPRPGKGKSRPGDDGAAKEPPPPPETLRRVLLRGLWASFRSLGAPFRVENLRKLYRQNPGELIMALAILVGCVGFLAYAARIYFTYFYSEQFTRYPEPIAKALRRALYYSNYNPDPKRALKYYKQALELCDEHHLDPFSDDVMGIKIQLAAWLEKIEDYRGATKVLETLLGDCRRWVQKMDAHVKEGTLHKVLPPPPPAPAPSTNPKDTTQTESQPIEEPETLWGRRTRILGKSVGISVKLAELYSDEHVLEKNLAHERLIWAVETALGELRRRTVEGAKEGEGQWMSSEQIGATLESLGHSYEAKSQFHLALPLFFQALRLCNDQCHSAILIGADLAGIHDILALRQLLTVTVNNLATCFAQHPLLGPGEAPVDAMMEQPEAGTPAARRESYLVAARHWASNAQQHATEPQGDQRTAECDEACVTSLCNLGTIASLSGDSAEAHRRFEQAVSLAKRIGYTPGVVEAGAGLRALSK